MSRDVCSSTRAVVLSLIGVGGAAGTVAAATPRTGAGERSHYRANGNRLLPELRWLRFSRRSLSSTGANGRRKWRVRRRGRPTRARLRIRSRRRRMERRAAFRKDGTSWVRPARASWGSEVSRAVCLPPGTLRRRHIRVVYGGLPGSRSPECADRLRTRISSTFRIRCLQPRYKARVGDSCQCRSHRMGRNLLRKRVRFAAAARARRRTRVKSSPSQLTQVGSSSATLAAVFNQAKRCSQPSRQADCHS